MIDKNLNIAVLTGATGGIGFYLCRYLLERGYAVIAPCRNMQKGASVKDDLSKYGSKDRLLFIDADLENLQSVKVFCTKVLSMTDKIDLLINNAGIIAPEFKLTCDGFERSLQVNYIAPVLIIETLLPIIDREIINTVSCTVKRGKLDEYSKKLSSMPLEKMISYKMTPNEFSYQREHFGHLKNYSASKLLLWNVTIALSKRLNNKIIVEGADPGVVNTNIITMHRWYDPLANLLFRPFIKSPEKGADAIIKKIRF